MGASTDTIIGRDEANRLEAGAGNDSIDGLGGDDVLIGGTGDDQLTGGLGSDTFHFRLGDGQDIIYDFEDGVDLLDFTATGLSFADLSITTAGSSTLVGYDNGQQIELQNTAGLIDQDDFVFV